MDCLALMRYYSKQLKAEIKQLKNPVSESDKPAAQLLKQVETIEKMTPESVKLLESTEQEALIRRLQEKIDILKGIHVSIALGLA